MKILKLFKCHVKSLSNVESTCTCSIRIVQVKVKTAGITRVTLYGKRKLFVVI